MSPLGSTAKYALAPRCTVTDEKPTGTLKRPNSPDVCTDLGVTTMDVLQLIKAEKWVVG
jgi:hypothetical protein